jgi:hypothetical protein
MHSGRFVSLAIFVSFVIKRAVPQPRSVDGQSADAIPGN